MIKIEKTQVIGFEPAVRGMRNAMESWDKSDSYFHGLYDVGPEDIKLMVKLAKAGSDHAKYRRMIVVYADITAPLYWWKEYDTYKVGTVANSCSTMHKIHSRELTLDDFSHEHLVSQGPHGEQGVWDAPECLTHTINVLNYFRDHYLRHPENKAYWWQMIQLLPSSYNQKRTVMLNYEVLSNIYHARKNHKLDEWHEFCDWVKKLPYSEMITLEDCKNE